MDKNNEGKNKFLLKQYNKPKTCDKVIGSHCNQGICNINLSSSQCSTDISLQTILLYIVKASYAIFYSYDKLVFLNNEASKNIQSMLIDSVPLLGLSTVEINSLRRDPMKYRLPVHLRRLAKDVPSDSKFLFTDDIQRRVSQILATNSALQKSKIATIPAADKPLATTKGNISHTTRATTAKVAITEVQKASKHPRGSLLMGKRAAGSRTITRAKGTKC